MQFTSVTLLIWAMFRYPVVPEPPVNRRIAIAMGLASRNTVFELPVLSQLLGFAVMAAKRFPFFRRLIRQDLEASGNPSGYSVDEYVAICLATGVGLTLFLSAVLWQVGQFDFLYAAVAPFVGFAIPVWTLHETAQARLRVIAKKLPYTLDLVALLMEAGATFTEAIETLVRDEPEDEFNQELRLVQSEIEFGTTRARALENLSSRIPLESVRSVVGAINQAEALGTPLSMILKSQSGMIRQMRSVRAEEASASASMRILVPSMLILFAVVLVVFSPMILNWMQGRLMDF